MLDFVVQSTGFVASALVFLTFYMHTMLPLRCVAITSNIAFLAYGISLRLWPVAILHAVLLPLNLVRLGQIRRMLGDIRKSRDGNVDLHSIARSFHSVSHPGGTVLFRRGDEGDTAYYIAEGEIALPELGVRCGPGDLLGEIAIFSPDHMRTASAICVTDVLLYRIDEQAIVVAFHQTSPFAFALLRLITRRLLENLARLEGEVDELRARRSYGD